MNSIHTARIADAAPENLVAAPDRIKTERVVGYGPLGVTLTAVIRNDRVVSAPDGDGKDAFTLSENFNAEIDAWARQALCRNGFGDF